MDNGRSQSSSRITSYLSIRRLYSFLAARPFSVIMFGAIFCTLAVKFFHSWRNNLVNEYVGWILADISVLLGIEVILALVCFGWPRKLVVRIATIFAAIVCTWSVMNASWLIRMGRQILPPVLLSLIRDPLSALGMIGVNLAKMPEAAVILLAPSAVALTFFFFVLAKPKLPGYNQKRFIKRTIICIIIILTAVSLRDVVVRQSSSQTISEEMRYNCHLRAITSLFFSGTGQLAKADFENAKRRIPAFDQVQITMSPSSPRINHNVVIVILEGVQYRYTSLAEPRSNLTPHLAALAGQGAEFVNTRSTLTHTTKGLFSLLTGRFPSASQDLAETVPAAKPYAGIATILKNSLNFRTAFFQSAKGNFEARPGLIYNLGFDKFWARDDLNDPNAFIGYLACDEFSMLKPISEWIKAEQRPFLLMVLCSVTHDPYEVPEWFAEPAKEPVERYRQVISYTDKFIAALDAELAKLNLVDNTIFCVVGDHGEAFGEHGLLGHERIAFDEVLRVPFCLRAPSLVKPKSKVIEPVSSIDLVPTLLALFGFDTNSVGFDGTDALGHIPDDRRVYFSGWMQQGPTGFVKGDRKFIYNPMDKMVSVYGLSTDPFELVRIELAEQQAQEIADDIITWRKNSIFRLDQKRTGRKVLFDSWLCRWTNRVSSVKYRKKEHK
ncbi:MAG TPA: sulfatase-like hydrolase/transferase [Sedimentisphaerales bacterium]|nr:sulfatase-like hydrolase/transferase [Sedimentisphaerales bacterium]